MNTYLNHSTLYISPEFFFLACSNLSWRPRIVEEFSKLCSKFILFARMCLSQEVSCI